MPYNEWKNCEGRNMGQHLRIQCFPQSNLRSKCQGQKISHSKLLFLQLFSTDLCCVITGLQNKQKLKPKEHCERPSHPALCLPPYGPWVLFPRGFKLPLKIIIKKTNNLDTFIFSLLLFSLFWSLPTN